MIMMNHKEKKMPTKSQEYVLEIKETLSGIEKKINPILSVATKGKPEEKNNLESSQLVLALKEVLEQAQSLMSRIDL